METAVTTATLFQVCGPVRNTRDPSLSITKERLTSHVNRHTAVKSLQSQNSKEKRFFLPQKIDT